MPHTLPEITESSKFNLFTSIWIVPFIALIIAAWLAYQYFSDRGPEIKIIFPQNEGLVAGQSFVKFRNIPVGKVTKIYAEEETDGVIVVVRMNSKKSSPYLTENARFWIVKPEVGVSGISGLDTLISGTYINVYSTAGGKHRKSSFIGLTQPYRESGRGEYFRLRSFSGDNVEVGTPVYYKNIKVGQVEYLYLGLDNKNIEIIVFMDKQYVPFVHDTSKFWVKSNVNFDFSKGNFDVNIASFKHLIQGGISFSSPGEAKGKNISEKHAFYLYKNKTAAESKLIGSEFETHKQFLLLTEQSVANLKVDSVVRFEGFNIGRVHHMELSYNKKRHKILGQIVLDIDTSVFRDSHDVNSSGESNFYQAVKEGLRAKIASLDPITGMQFIDLTFEHDDGNSTIVQDGRYARLPIAGTSSGSIMTSVTEILDKLNHLPLNELVTSVTQVVTSTRQPIENANTLLLDLQTTVKNVNKFTGKKSFEVMPDQLNKALKEMTHTLKTTEKVLKGYGNNSLAKQQLAQTLEVLSKTSQEMQLFLRMLNRKPNSLIFGDN